MLRAALIALTGLLAGLPQNDRSSVVRPDRVVAARVPHNPLITVKSSPSLGDNVNGPASSGCRPGSRRPSAVTTCILRTTTAGSFGWPTPTALRDRGRLMSPACCPLSSPRSTARSRTRRPRAPANACMSRRLMSTSIRREDGFSCGLMAGGPTTNRGRTPIPSRLPRGHASGLRNQGRRRRRVYISRVRSRLREPVTFACSGSSGHLLRCRETWTPRAVAPAARRVRDWSQPVWRNRLPQPRSSRGAVAPWHPFARVLQRDR